MANRGTKGNSGKSGAKRPSSSKKKPVRAKKRGIHLNREYHNLILIFLGLFLIYGLSSSSGAILPRVIQMILKGMFGGLGIIVPIVMIVLGILGFIDGNERIDRFRKTKVFYIAILFLIIYYGLVNYARTPSESPLKGDVFQDLIKMGVSGEGLGLVPSFIIYYLTRMLGYVGAWLLTVFATLITILYIFNININELISIFGQSKNNGLISKLKFKRDKTDKDTDILSEKTGFFDKIRSKFASKNDEDGVDDIDDEQIYSEEDDKTIKIVGFNKADDDYLEILEGTQSLSDLEILQRMQNEESISDSIFPNVDLPKKNSPQKSSSMSKVESFGDAIESGEQENEHLKYADYKKPAINLLKKVEQKNDKKSKKKVLENARKLERTLMDFGVEASINQVTVGPTITRYEIQPKPGVKVSKIVNLTDDIALSLAAKSIRIEAPIPGKSAIGIEVPNDESQMVTIREIIESSEFNNFKSPLAMGLGKDVSGKIIIGDIAKMPHLLIAGSTGSGKSVCVNTLITSILYKSKPDEVKLMLIDPKVVELANYNGIPHLLVPVVTDAKKAANALYWAVTEMNRRYNLFAEAQVKDISSYNEKTDNPLPKIVIIIDELADLMMVSSNEVEDYICRLAQMARAAGMHLIVATQRPSVDVITGVIKANIPSRIAFAVSSQTDSRTIIDMGGAEKLLGKGDMLFYPLGANKPVRLQGAFISEEESDRVIDHVKSEAGEVEFSNEIEQSISSVNTMKDDSADELLSDVIDFVVMSGQASASMLQRKFKIGFNRAARLVDDMEERGIIGPSEGSKPRKVLISKEEYDEWRN